MKLRVLFVGAFRAAAADGSIGGQAVVCRALVESPIAEHVEWRLLDSTQRSFPYPTLPARAWAASRRVASFLRQLAGADAVLLFAAALGPSILEKGLMAAIARMAGRTVVFAVRSEVPQAGRARMLLRASLRACHTIWVQSDRARQSVVELMAPRDVRVVVIPNFLGAARAAGRPRAADEPFTVVFAGWIAPWKGVPDLVEAFARLHADCPSARLIVCGDGPGTPGLRARVAALGIEGSVTLTGWVDRGGIEETFGRSSVLVLPSYTEGMPNVVLEAMAAGLPVVATNVGGVPELVEDGVTGYLVPPRDPPAIADRLRALARDAALRRAMGERGRARLLERFVDSRWWPDVLKELKGLEQMTTASGGAHDVAG